VLALTVSAFAADPTFVVIPDAHLNATGQPATWVTQAAWIVANQAAWNIQGVFSTGDWANPGASGTLLPLAWSDGLQSVDAMGKPWGSAVGNHDTDAGETSGEASRVFTIFDAQIGNARLSGKPWYGGSWSTSDVNYYLQFVEPTTRRKFLVMFLEFFPRSGALTWAGGIISANPTWEVIVLTHGYMQTDGTLAAAGSQYGPNYYSLNGDASGVDIEAWAAQFSNVRAVLCGHWIPSPTHALRTDSTTNGTLLGIFTNFQSASPNSQSVLLMSFQPTTVTLRLVNTTTGAVDTTSYVDLGTPIAWQASQTGLWPLPSPVGR
jgi:Calcineurin-like phosphoesterase